MHIRQWLRLVHLLIMHLPLLHLSLLHLAHLINLAYGKWAITWMRHRTAQRIVLNRIRLNNVSAVYLLRNHWLLYNLVVELGQRDIVDKHQAQIIGLISAWTIATHHKSLNLLDTLLAIRYAKGCCA